MKRLLVTAIVISSSSAFANPLAPLPAKLPNNCASLAVVPASATIPGPTLAAHVSVANCLAEAAMNALTISPDALSISRLDAAVAPSVAILDDVISTGDPYYKKVAQEAKLDLYDSMIVRERASRTKSDVASIDALETKLDPWRALADRAANAIARR